MRINVRLKAMVNQNNFCRWHQNCDAEKKYGQDTTNVTESSRYFLENDAVQRNLMEMNRKHTNYKIVSII